MNAGKENGPLTGYRPGNLQEYREMLRRKRDQEKQMQEITNNLNTTNITQKMAPQTVQKPRPVVQSTKTNQSSRKPIAPTTKQTITRPATAGNVPDFQKKFQALHQKEQERIQQFQTQNRRQTIARSPIFNRAPPTTVSKPNVQEKKEEEFVADPKSLSAIMGSRQDTGLDSRRTTTARSAGSNTTMDIPPTGRVTTFGGRCMPLSHYYSSNNAPNFDSRPSVTQTPMKTPSRQNQVPFTPRSILKQESQFGNTNVRESTGGNNAMLKAVLEQQMNSDQPPEVQRQIRNLLSLLQEKPEERQACPQPTPQRQDGLVACPVPRTIERVPLSYKSPPQPTQYEPSDVVKRLFSDV